MTFPTSKPSNILDFSGQPIKRLPAGLEKVEGAALVVTGCEQLTSLAGSPTVVTTLRAKGCKSLKTLQGGPTRVSGNVFLKDSGVESLEGLMYVEGNLSAEGCNIISLHGVGMKYLKRCSHLRVGPKLKSNILGLMFVDDLHEVWLDEEGANVELTNAMKILNEYLKIKVLSGQERVIDCQHKLIEAGLEDYAEL